MANPTTDSMMYLTMHRQPSDLRRILTDGWAAATDAADRLRGARRLFVVGIGTSYHAALFGAWVFRAAGLDARAVSSFDFALYEEAAALKTGDAVVVMAHSGVKRFSSESMLRANRADMPVVSVGSLTAEHPDSDLILRTVEREKSAAFTASHLAAMTVLAQVATVIGERDNAKGTAGFRDALAKLPDQVADMLQREADVLPISRYAVDHRIYACGGGPNEIAAIEAVIKVREAAYGWIDGLALEQFIHGPMISVNAGDLIALVNHPGRSAERNAQAATMFEGFGAKVWLIGDAVPTAPEASVFPIPHSHELISPIVATVPYQILAYQMAALKGVHPDTFRRDDPKYFAAMQHCKL